MKINIAPYILFLLVFIFACNKKEEIEPMDDFQFSALQIEKDTLMAGEETKIKAMATGVELTYLWSATKGDILGFGKEIIYVSSPCHLGSNTITCTVKNESNYSETKNVNVFVLE